jgi:predicted nucleic acid-binding Zn ribbon protein
MRQQNNIGNGPVSELTVADATSRVYASLEADNEDIDRHIAALKDALKREGLKEAVLDPARLVQNNRSGRKLLQAYFRQRGVKVAFAS